jgi:PAS domain-containing protein
MADDTFDDYIPQLRADLEGTPPRLNRVASQLERIPACVLIADDQGRYIATNDRACALTGLLPCGAASEIGRRPDRTE